MVYECEKCGIALPSGVLNCPKCGEGFDEPVPQDAEVPTRGWQPKSGSSVFSSTSSQPEIETPGNPTVVSRQGYNSNPEQPSPIFPKLGKLSPSHLIFAIICWPVGLVLIVLWISQHPRWSVKAKAVFIGSILAAILIVAEIINLQEGRNPTTPQKTATVPAEQYRRPKLISARDAKEQVAQQAKSDKEAQEAKQRSIAAQTAAAGKSQQERIVSADKAKKEHLVASRQIVHQKIAAVKSAMRVAAVKPTKMVNVGAIFGKSYRQVNRIIGGKPYHTEYHAASEDLYGLPNGATERSYGSDGKVPLSSGVDDITIDFDTNNKAKIVYIISTSYSPIGNYTLSEWNTLLTNLGLPNQPKPDTLALSGMSWNSPAPYHIVLGAMDDGCPGKITDLKIMPREVQDRGESQP